MRWWSCALVLGIATAGCGGSPVAGDARDADVEAVVTDVGLDGASADANVDATPSIDAGRDASDATTSLDVGTTDAHGCAAGGDCTLPGGGAGQCCDGVCMDLTGDATHCGRCHYACRVGMSCVEGACAYSSCGDASFLGPYGSHDIFSARCVGSDGSGGFCCDGACHALTDFDSDPANCGGCGLACAIGQTCTSGRCGPGYCGATASCAAGTSCVGGDACIASSCAGQPDETLCPLAGFGQIGACCAGTCIDPLADRANCGACGHACSADTVCTYGACYAPHVCTENGAASTTCALASGAIGRCCGPRCVDTAADDANCGACTVACASGSSCVDTGFGGECVATPADGGLGVPQCTRDADCPAGTQCNADGQYCVRLDCTGVPDGEACHASDNTFTYGLCCGGRCTDTTLSPNCGACGVSCSSGVCVEVDSWPLHPITTCLPDRAASADCSGAGGCPSGDTCVGGVCVPPTCRTIYSLCASASGGAGICDWDLSGTPVLVCRDLASDPSYCGAGGATCSPTQTCVRGACVP